MKSSVIAAGTTDRPFTNREARYQLRVKIKGIEFDISCLQGARNAKARDVLYERLEDYKRRIETVPDDDEVFVKEDYLRANERRGNDAS